MRVAGELTEIRGEDLRFTLEESRALLKAAGVRLSDGALESLVARTEGWVAGLRLVALSLARHPDPEHYAVSFSGRERAVADYLLAEVLERQPAEVRQLLLRTSLLERVSGPLADRLTGSSGSERILMQLEDAGAFVVAVDPERSWFRYHHLFGDLLALELRRTAPQEVPGLHTIAAEWWAEHGYPVEAIRHAQAAENWGLAARLLADNWFGLYFDGRSPPAVSFCLGFLPGWSQRMPSWWCSPGPTSGRRGHWRRAGGIWGWRYGCRRRCPKTVAGALRSRLRSSDSSSLGPATTFGPLPRRRSDCSPQPRPRNLASARRSAQGC